jgi:WD40 repeat protein
MEHQERVIDLEFSPDGNWVVSGSWDYSARVWEASTGREISRMTHGGWIGSVNFSPDGRWVLSGSADGTARIWDARTGQEVARTMHDSAAPASEFSPDGRMAVSGSVDHTVRVWYWMVDDITRQACRHLPRNLTQDEWNRYVYNQTYHQTCENLPVEE